MENEDLATFTATFASGATGTFSVSRVAYGLPNSLGFEVFTASGAATFDLARAGEFGLIDGTPAGPTQGYRQVLVGPAHLPHQGPPDGLPRGRLRAERPVHLPGPGLPGAGRGAGGAARLASFEEGLHNLRLLDAVVASAKAGGADVTID